MGWSSRSWLLSDLLAEETILSLASVLYVLVAAGFLAGDVGYALGRDWATPVLVNEDGDEGRNRSPEPIADEEYVTGGEDDVRWPPESERGESDLERGPDSVSEGSRAPGYERPTRPSRPLMSGGKHRNANDDN